MLELEQAVARILEAMPHPKAEVLSLSAAEGRIAGKPVIAPIDLPLFTNSSMDGYAVRAQDIQEAAAESPVRLRLAGRVAAGEDFAGTLQRGQCIRLFTGSPLPNGADAVVMQEQTRPSIGDAQEIEFLEPVQPGENVRPQGEDVRCGSELLPAGQVISVGHLALLSAGGITELSVSRQPTVAILATGSELEEPGQPLVRGHLYESNRLPLSALLRHAGAIPKTFPLVPDSLAATRAALTSAFQESDIVLTCGGASVGEMDFVKAAFEETGGTLGFWKVAVKPGKPFVFGRRDDKFLFGLPGNPVSALVTFLLLVRPAIRRWQGALDIDLPTVQGVAAESLRNFGDRRHFLRVCMDGAGAVRSAGTQASHVLHSLAAANGLVDVPPHGTIDTGSAVTVMLWK